MKTKHCICSRAQKLAGGLFLSLAALAVSFGTSHAAVLYTSNGFEASGGPPDFNVGTIVGQNSGGGTWSNQAGTSSNKMIEDSIFYAGSQAFGLLNSVTAETTRLTLTTALTGNVFIDGYFQPPAVADIGAPFTMTLRTSANSILAQIKFLNTGKLGVANPNSSTLGNYTYTQGVFNRLTIGINSATNTFTIYLNGQSFEGGQDLALGAAYSDLGRIDFSYTSNTTNSGGGYVDNFAIYDVSPIPEPGTTVLLGAGLLLVTVLRRWGWRADEAKN
jgi:hypothetical protein